MKVFHYSEQPAKPSPYIHVGYLSARTYKFGGTLFCIGVVLVVTGLFGRSSIAKRAINGLFSATVANRIVWMVSFGSGLAAVLGVLLLIQPLPFRTLGGYEHPVGLTRAKAQNIAYSLIEFTDPPAFPVPKEDRREIPRPLSVDEAYKQLGVSTGGEVSLDGWEKPFRIEKRKERERLEFIVRSAGADGRFDTEDDAVVDTAEIKKRWDIKPNITGTITDHGS